MTTPSKRWIRAFKPRGTSLTRSKIYRASKLKNCRWSKSLLPTGRSCPRWTKTLTLTRKICSIWICALNSMPPSFAKTRDSRKGTILWLEGSARLTRAQREKIRALGHQIPVLRALNNWSWPSKMQPILRKSSWARAEGNHTPRISSRAESSTPRSCPSTWTQGLTRREDRI